MTITAAIRVENDREREKGAKGGSGHHLCERNLRERREKGSKSMESFHTDRAQMGARKNKHAHGIRADKRGTWRGGTAGEGAEGD
jgi:hypothetical protein